MLMYKWFLSACMCAGCALGSLGLMSHAYADNCDNFDRNKAWMSNMEKLNDACEKEDWHAALRYSRDLEQICDQSPILNYTIAQIHKKLGDNEKYLFYLQKSTQNTEKYSIDKNLLDKIWTEKYIAVNPEADPARIKEREAEIARKDEEVLALKEQLSSVKITAVEAGALQDEVNDARALDDVWLWTSVAVSGTGIILTAVGAVMLSHAKGDHASIETKDGQTYVSSRYTASWGLIGAGIATTLIGAATTGYFGYKYKKNHQNDNVNELSFQISPTYSSLTLTF